jgi:UDP-2-acetamido-3-amino-2,3-dideoxy-glucuronate N-acetyltransferase
MLESGITAYNNGVTSTFAWRTNRDRPAAGRDVWLGRFAIQVCVPKKHEQLGRDPFFYRIKEDPLRAIVIFFLLRAVFKPAMTVCLICQQSPVLPGSFGESFRLRVYLGVHMPIAQNVQLGLNVQIPHPELVNLYGCIVGDGTRIASFVEIQKNARIGANCKVSSHSFICEGVTIEDECFIGHHVCFINDNFPRATSAAGSLQTEADWKVIPTRVCRGASIGSGAVIKCGITIGEGALVGAGAVVTRDVPARQIVAGVPARILREISTDG